jgi:hypothetical protein
MRVITVRTKVRLMPLGREQVPGLLIRSLQSLLYTRKGAFNTRCLEKVQLIKVQKAQEVLLYPQVLHLTHEQSVVCDLF